MQTKSGSKSQTTSSRLSDSAKSKQLEKVKKGGSKDEEKTETREEMISRRFKDLLGKDKGPIPWTNDLIKVQMLSGSWALSTVEGMNTAVWKLKAFGLACKVPTNKLIPLAEQRLHEFIVWAGCRLESEGGNDQKHKIKSSTIETYITGIRSWHLFHHEYFPDTRSKKTQLLLKAANAGDEEVGVVKPKDKPPVLLRHLRHLLEALSTNNRRHQAALTIALVAFWGMARLGELVGGGEKQRREILMRPVVWADDNRSFLKIKIYDAKTARAGGVQFLTLTRRKSLFDAVGAIERLVEVNKTQPEHPLFLYIEQNGTRGAFQKNKLIGVYKSVWKKKEPDTDLSAHSFRVGGATIRWNDKTLLETIVKLGRWHTRGTYRLIVHKKRKTQSNGGCSWNCRWNRCGLKDE